MSWRRTHEWGALTRDEIVQARDAGALAVLPCGSVEQHGDHLPLDVDLVSVWRVALLAAERCRAVHALVLPALPYGVAPEHAAWPGTITLSTATFQAVLREVVESVRRSGFRRVLVVNGHGGNQAALADLGADGLRVTVVNYWSPGQAEWTTVLPGGKPTMGHACAYETAMQLALRPDERERIRTRIAGLPPRLTAPPGMVFGPGDPGYYGDPAAAADAPAAPILERTVAALARYYAEVGA